MFDLLTRVNTKIVEPLPHIVSTMPCGARNACHSVSRLVYLPAATVPNGPTP